MFNTDPNHWLQNLDSPFFHWFFEAVSALGTVAVLTVILYTIIVGVDFRKGFGVANIFFYVVIITLICKKAVDFPRPMAVDNTLNSFDRKFTKENLRPIQPKGFFELFSTQVLQKIRAKKIAREGFPSGHTSLITALLIGSALIFKRRWIWYMGGVIVFLMMLSRMYLARHYLGDVLGGLGVGLVLTFVVYNVWKSLQNKGQLTQAQTIFFLTPYLFLPLFAWVHAFPTGTFIGLNTGFVILARAWGLPQFSENLRRRSLSVFIFVLYAFLTTYISRRLGLAQYSILSMLFFATLALIAFLAAAFTCIKAGWWQKELITEPQK